MTDSHDLSQRRAQLSDAKRELLQRWLKGNAAPAAIPRRHGDGPLPLSHVQRRIWFLEQLVPGTPVYHIEWAVQMTGELDRDAMVRSLSEIVQRHETLRTTFRLTASGPVQEVGPAYMVSLPLTDLRHLPREVQEGAVLAQAKQVADQPFDLARGPLLRTHLFRLDAGEHLLLFSVHHLVADGSSTAILSQELATLYTAFTSGKPSPLPALPVQFGDYVLWQEQRLQDQAMHEQMDYWLQKVKGSQPMCQMPTDYPRPAHPLFQGASERLLLPAELVARLQDLGQAEGATLFMVLLAAFKVLLSRYSGQEDVIVGAPVANRGRAEIDGLIGCFANTVALRSDLAGDPTFRELLARVRQTATEAFSRQDVPLDRLAEQFRSELGAGFTPFFQVLFVLQNMRAPVANLPNLTLQLVRLPNETSRFEVLVYFNEDENGITCQLDYLTELFAATSIQQFLGHYRRMLEAVLAHPGEPISRLLPGEVERHPWVEGQPAKAVTSAGPAASGGKATLATETEQRLAALFRELLKVTAVGPDDNFFDLGGHSLLATQLIFQVYDTFGVEVPLQELFAVPTVAGMARAVDGASGGGPAQRDLATDVVLDPAVVPPGPVSITPAPRELFLTGATGFVGSFLLHELLERTGATVHCLVRAESAGEGLDRIRGALEKYDLWRDSYAGRIKPVPGALDKPLLGLDQEAFEELALRVEAIYHNGAAVNFMLPYEEMKATNVQGIQEVLRLAAQGRHKPLHHVSTVGIFPLTGGVVGDPLKEEVLPADPSHLTIGYTQSKWVAEQIIARARERGLAVAVYRLGRVTGHSETGAFQTKDFVWNVIKVCIELGAAPDIDALIDMVPVDYATRALVALSQRPDSLGQNFHLAQREPASLMQMVRWVRAFGYGLELLPYPVWRQRLRTFAQQAPESAAARLLPVLGEQLGSEAFDQHFDSSNAAAGLVGSGIACPPVDGPMLALYLDYLVRVGFLPAPRNQNSTQIPVGRNR